MLLHKLPRARITVIINILASHLKSRNVRITKFDSRQRLISNIQSVFLVKLAYDGLVLGTNQFLLLP